MNSLTKDTSISSISFRRWLRIIIFVVSLLTGISLVFTFAPSYIVQHLVKDELNALGVSHDGIGTLKLNLWRGEAWLGPVQFSVGEAKHGQIGEVGVKVNLLSLFKKRAMIERILIRGIDIGIERNKENVITLNGIPLNQFLIADTKSTDNETSGTSWGKGLTDFELRDSRASIRKKTGGELIVQIDSLFLGGFHTWNPDTEGLFKLAARVNDITLEWQGEARPFAEEITFRIDSRTLNADLPKIVAFIGPTGLDRLTGVYNAYLNHDITITSKGRIKGHTNGTIQATGADYADKGNFELTFDRSEVQIDTHYILDESNNFQFNGLIDIEMGKTKSWIEPKNSFNFLSARVNFKEIDFTLGAEKLLHIAGKSAIELSNPKFSGEIQFSLNKLLDLLTYLQSLSSWQTTTDEHTGLADWRTSDEVTLPQTDISAEILSMPAGSFKFASEKGDVLLHLTSDTTFSNLKIVTEDQSSTIKELHSNLKNLELRSGQGELSLKLNGDNLLIGSHAKTSVGEALFDRASATIDNLNLVTRSGELKANAIAEVLFKGTKISARAMEGVPASTGSLSELHAHMSDGKLSIVDDQLSWQGLGSTTIDGLQLMFSYGKEASTKFQQLELRNAYVRAERILNLEADSVRVKGLDVFLTRRFVKNIRDLIKLYSNKENSNKKDDITTATPSQGIDSSLKLEWEASSLIVQIQHHLKELGYLLGHADGQTGPQTRTAIRSFEKESGLPVTGEPSTELLTALEYARFWPFGLKLANFTLTDNASLRFKDRQVNPEVNIVGIFDTAEVLDLNLRNIRQRTNAHLRATVNEFTQIDLDGWTTALGPKANGEISASLANLDLPPYSPYSAQLSGLQIDSGQLSKTVTMSAESGNLKGTVDVDLSDVKFKRISEADVERLEKQMGVQLKIAVALLQDPRGHIKLTLPVQGSLSDPAIDTSIAVNEAIGRGLRKIFPPKLVASIILPKEYGAELTFEPIIFTPGTVELNDNAMSYVESLVTLLKERPKLTLHVCGRTTETDFLAKSGYKSLTTSNATQNEKVLRDRDILIKKYTTELRELAKQRTQVIRRYIITEQGIDAKRLTECRILFDADEKGPPRVDILL